MHLILMSIAAAQPFYWFTVAQPETRHIAVRPQQRSQCARERGHNMATIKLTTDKQGKSRYRVRVRKNGVYKSKTFRVKSEADRWASETEGGVALGAIRKASGKTVRDMIDRYCKEILPHKAKNSQTSQKGQLSWWKDQIGGLSLAEVKPLVIAKALDARHPCSNATIISYLAALQHVFEIAAKQWHWCEPNPVRTVRRPPRPQGRDKILENAERERLLFYCRLASCPVLETIVIVALSTGARKSEIRFMRFAEYDHANGHVILNETKTRQRRKVRLFGEARRRMAALYEAMTPEQEFFFHSPRNPSRPVDFRSAWEKALEEAGISDFHFHDLRHTAASFLAAQGASLDDIGEILGHKSIQTTQRYAHLTESRTDALLQKVSMAIF